MHKCKFRTPQQIVGGSQHAIQVMQLKRETCMPYKQQGWVTCLLLIQQQHLQVLARISFLFRALCVSFCFPASVMAAWASVLSWCRCCASPSCLFKSLQFTSSPQFQLALRWLSWLRKSTHMSVILCLQSTAHSRHISCMEILKAALT